MPEPPDQHTDSAMTSDDAARDKDELLAALVTFRHTLGLTQTEVAAAMGTKPGAVSRFESGRTDPRLSTVRAYCHALGARLAATLGSH